MHPTLPSSGVSRYVVAGILALNSVALAQVASPGSISILQGIGNKGPWNEPQAEFDLILDKPNATGIFPIAGPNISVPYTASSRIDGWSWSIVVAADLPIANSSTQAARYGDEFYTGGKLTFHGPSSLLQASSQNLSVNDDWELCIYRWQLDGADYPDKLLSDDGTCSSVLSTQCISDMEKAVSVNTGASWCECPLSRNIPSCAALGNASALWDSTCAGSLYNASAIRAWEDGIFDVESFGGATAHERGNITAYNYIGSVAWPVMTSFGNGNGSHTATTMSCVRAKNATEGSTAPTGDGLVDEQEGAGQGGDAKGVGTSTVVSWITLAVFSTLSCFIGF